MDHHARIEEEVAHCAAEFLNREANRNTLITVTRAVATRDARKIDVLVSVYPESNEATALHFLKRKRSLFREYVKKHTRLKMIPLLDFLIDYGEKNRQHIDELSHK